VGWGQRTTLSESDAARATILIRFSYSGEIAVYLCGTRVVWIAETIEQGLADHRVLCTTELLQPRHAIQPLLPGREYELTGIDRPLPGELDELLVTVNSDHRRAATNKISRHVPNPATQIEDQLAFDPRQLFRRPLTRSARRIG